MIDGARRGVDLAAVYGGTQPSMDSWEPFAIAYAGVLHFAGEAIVNSAAGQKDS